MQTLKVKYLNSNLLPLEQKQGSDWIDLRCAQPDGINLKQGEFKLIPLGVIIQLPKNHEAHIAPRSSTFKTWGMIQTNSVGVVDESYSGGKDQWFMPVYATRDTFINFNDRICQFRIFQKQPEIKFETLEFVNEQSRGGFGSTGVQ